MVALVVWSLLAALPEFEVRAADGTTLRGRLVGCTAEALTVDTAEGPRRLAAGDVAGVAAVAPAMVEAVAAPVELELLDGTRLIAAELTLSGEVTRVVLPGAAALDVPTRTVTAVKLMPLDGPLDEQWQEIAAAKRTGDLLVIRKGDALDFLEGVVQEVTADEVRFQFEGETVPVRRGRVVGWFHPAAPAPGGRAAFATLDDAAGSRWAVAELKLPGPDAPADAAGTVAVVTPAGIEARLPLDRLRELTYRSDFLSDLAPESVAWVPYFGLADPGDGLLARLYGPRFNRSLRPGPLRLGGQEYAKGLALHSRSEVVFRLPEGYRSLRATVGIDDRVRPGGQVQFKILGDERTLLDVAVSGQDPPRPIEIDLTGVRRLKLLVDFGEGADRQDHFDICEPRLVR